MFHKVAKTGITKIGPKADLQPKYDYINFVDVVMKDKRTTNSLYITTLNEALLTASKKAKPPIADVIADSINETTILHSSSKNIVTFGEKK
ncbi:unnamed protein product [Rhizopus stolonifer]